MTESLGTKMVRRLRQFASDLRSGKPLKVRTVGDISPQEAQRAMRSICQVGRYGIDDGKLEHEYGELICTNAAGQEYIVREFWTVSWRAGDDSYVMSAPKVLDVLLAFVQNVKSGVYSQ